MSRYIDADKLKQHYAYWGSSKYDYMQEEKKLFDDIVDQQPTVDAVEVVRCKDCKHYVLYTLFGHTQGWCERLCDEFDKSLAHGTEEDDFCSHGERADT